jgi:hypothetical protein
MIVLAFAAFLVLSMTVALTDWRRGWIMAVLCGVLQDPARKLTPGTPVLMTLSVIVVYAAVLLAGSSALQRDAREFGRRFATVYAAVILVALFIALAALRGLFTYGLTGWKAPALSLFIYCAPVPAVILGYAYLRREEQLYAFFRFYAVLTAVALIGTPLEYWNVQSRVLGTVALSEAYIRHLPGIQIRLLSGFYRAPDIMSWHAAMLTIVGMIMTLRAKVFHQAWPWILLISWGFLNCLLSGRRKAVYMVAVFAIILLWRYFYRLTVAQVITFMMALAVVGIVVHKISKDEQSSVYARGTVTTRSEVLERLEGGLGETIRQFGILGAGLGAATQGVQHVTPGGRVGWQEGGLGKLAVELGVPGLLAVVVLGLAMFRTMMKISAHPDVPGSPQLIRASLFAIVIANAVEFLASAQAYSDVVLILMSAFFLGCLFATGVLDERMAAAPAPTPTHPRPLTAPATA